MDIKSVLGYQQNSPFRGRKQITINSPDGFIDMSNTDIPLVGRDNTGMTKILRPFSGMHKFRGNKITEYRMQDGGEYEDEAFDFLFEERDYGPTLPSESDLDGLVQETKIEQQAHQDDINDQLSLSVVMRDFYRGNKFKNLGFIESPQMSLNKQENIGNKARFSYDFFLSKGYSPEVAAGITANIQHESNFNTTAIGDKGKAKGIAQWHPDRYSQLSGKFDMNTLSGSLEALHYELQTSEKKARDRIVKSQTPEQAAAAVDKYYERSAGLSTGKRMNTARNIFNTK